MSKKIIIKTPEQIDGIRKASHLAALTRDMIEEFIKPGVSTEELDHIMNRYIMANGGKSACIGYHWYPKYTCISLNDTICHGIPNRNEFLQEWDILNVDVTVIMNWYYWDTSKMYTVGKVTDAAKNIIKVAKESLDIGIAEIYPENFFWNIGFAISKYAEKKWCGVVREYTGHGVGIEFHEEPYVYHKAAKNTGAIIKPGMIFTVEPMINEGTYKTKVLDDKWTVKTLDGSLSAQFEHTILVTEDGYEILTK